ncbi:MAG: crossover junction endodeoxyribonuclease RuvC [Bacteroidetes bacterium]|nr:crossover junction endodeoxyribonuclease RuvC [Bacteroidota bacterium]
MAAILPVTPERIIMGIDPGSRITGYAFVRARGSRLSLLSLGVIHLEKLSPDHLLRLHKLFERVQSMVQEFLPDEMAIEAPFQGKNVQSMLKLGRAQGVAIAAALSREVPVQEYAPTKVKMSITGKGRASKEQVAGMLLHLLPELKTHPERLLADATDALGVAVCHWMQGQPTGYTATKGKASWGKFLEQNPDRLRKT